MSRRYNTDLLRACNKYRCIAQLIVAENIFSRTNTKLMIAVELYVESYNNNMARLEYANNYYIILIESVHKLYPIRYYGRDKIDVNWLYNACISQQRYFYNTFNLISQYNPKKWIKSYYKMIKKCRKLSVNPAQYPVNSTRYSVNPTQYQDFVWRAHMQYNVLYVEDIRLYLNNVLDYDNSIIHRKYNLLPFADKKIYGIIPSDDMSGTNMCGTNMSETNMSESDSYTDHIDFSSWKWRNTLEIARY